MGMILEYIENAVSATELYQATNVAEKGLIVTFEGTYNEWFWSTWSKEKGSTFYEGFKTLDEAQRDAETKITFVMNFNDGTEMHAVRNPL